MQDNEMPSQENPMMMFGPYVLWDVDGDRFGLMNNDTGEIGVFEKDKFIAHLHAFFGLNF